MAEDYEQIRRQRYLDLKARRGDTAHSQHLRDLRIKFGKTKSWEPAQETAEDEARRKAIEPDVAARLSPDEDLARRMAEWQSEFDAFWKDFYGARQPEPLQPRAPSPEQFVGLGEELQGTPLSELFGGPETPAPGAPETPSPSTPPEASPPPPSPPGRAESLGADSAVPPAQPARAAEAPGGVPAAPVATPDVVGVSPPSPATTGQQQPSAVAIPESPSWSVSPPAPPRRVTPQIVGRKLRPPVAPEQPAQAVPIEAPTISRSVEPTIVLPPPETAPADSGLATSPSPISPPQVTVGAPVAPEASATASPVTAPSPPVAPVTGSTPIQSAGVPPVSENAWWPGQAVVPDKPAQPPTASPYVLPSGPLPWQDVTGGAPPSGSPAPPRPSAPSPPPQEAGGWPSPQAIDAQADEQAFEPQPEPPPDMVSRRGIRYRVATPEEAREAQSALDSTGVPPGFTAPGGGFQSAPDTTGNSNNQDVLREVLSVVQEIKKTVENHTTILTALRDQSSRGPTFA